MVNQLLTSEKHLERTVYVVDLLVLDLIFLLSHRWDLDFTLDEQTFNSTDTVFLHSVNHVKAKNTSQF